MMKSGLKLGVKRRREERIKQLFREPRHYSPLPEWRGHRTEQAWEEWQTPPTSKQFIYRIVICVIIYAVVWGAFAIDHPGAKKAEIFIKNSLTDSYNFTVAAAWYRKHIGGWPAFLPAFDGKDSTNTDADYTVPVSGFIIGPYSASRQGIWLSTVPNQTVATIRTGLVESVKEEPDTGLTVVIQHAGGIRSIYGFLEDASVEVHEWVKGGTEIGKVKTIRSEGIGKLYFAIMNNTSFVDPEDVISFD